MVSGPEVGSVTKYRGKTHVSESRGDRELKDGTSKWRGTWKTLLHGWGVSPIQADRTFEDIAQAYSSPGRFYHTLDHVMDMLGTVENLAAHTKRLNAVKLAVWLHDVIYDSKASDNEERSAQFAERLCKELAISESHLVAALIRKTKTHDAGEDVDAQVVIDADLAVLGATEQVYRDYAGKIRQEYVWVPESEYRAGRQRVLQNFLSRPKIFSEPAGGAGPAQHG
jgi:predicted metal-dependent HD superfamily phosphohydrolase